MEVTVKCFLVVNAGYVFIGLLLIFMIGFGLFGSRRHNKFALALAMCTNCFALFVLFVVVITIFSQVAPAFPVSVANECVTRGESWVDLARRSSAASADTNARFG